MADEPLSDEDYECTQEQLKLIASLMLEMPLEECLSRQSIADAVTPMAHPTLYMAAMDRWRLVKRITLAARNFQKEIQAVNAELEKLGPPKHKRGDFGPGLWG